MTGAEHATAKGSSRAWDHNQLVHAIWLQALLQRFHLWVIRVPTEDNVADLPSRSEYQLLYDMDGEWRDPTIADLYLQGICGVQLPVRRE